jgi:hypothetical protein
MRTRIPVNAQGRLDWETQTFRTATLTLLISHDWLAEWVCTPVAITSKRDDWKPIYDLLEDDFEVLLVNVQHVKHVPGCKTDILDSEWLAELPYGLLTGGPSESSFKQLLPSIVVFGAVVSLILAWTDTYLFFKDKITRLSSPIRSSLAEYQVLLKSYANVLRE